MTSKVKIKFIRWLKNHPDVWEKNEFGVPHYWWIQNCLGDLGYDVNKIPEVDVISKKHNSGSAGAVSSLGGVGHG